MSLVEILDPPEDKRTRRRWPGASLLVLTALGAASGFFLTTLIQPTYTASARLMVTGGADPTVPIHVRVETEVALVETPQVIARVIATERLNADRELGQHQASEWDRQVDAWGLTAWLGRAPLGHDVASRLADLIAVERVGDAALFDIRVTSRDANKAARLSNALVDAYLTERADLAVAPAQVVDPDALARLERAVIDAETALRDARIQTGQTEATESLDAQMAKARGRLADAEARVKRLEAAVRAGAGAVFDQDAEGGALRDLRRDHSEAVRRQADLLREYGPKHYRIIEANREIERLREQGFAEARRALDRARSEIARERETIRSLERAAPTATVADTNSREAVLARALHDARQAYEIARQRARAVAPSGGLLEPITTRVLSRATPPLVADQVSGTSVVTGGALLGLVLGLFLSLLSRPRRLPNIERITAPRPSANDDVPPEADAVAVAIPCVHEPSSLLALAGPFSGRDVILSLGDAGACHRAALALARAAASQSRVVLIEVDGDQTTARHGLADVLEGVARFTEALHADPLSPLHRMPAGRQPATRYHRFPLVLDALSATYDRVIIALGELPDVPELLATLDKADRVIVATDASPVVGAEAEAITALAAAISMDQSEFHVVSAPAAGGATLAAVSQRDGLAPRGGLRSAG